METHIYHANKLFLNGTRQKTKFVFIARQCSATRVQSQLAGFSAPARIARVMAYNLLIFEKPGRAREALRAMHGF